MIVEIYEKIIPKKLRFPKICETRVRLKVVDGWIHDLRNFATFFYVSR